jgi:uncharacterized hydrophobic protein (TIGR00271 family)
MLQDENLIGREQNARKVSWSLLQHWLSTSGLLSTNRSATKVQQDVRESIEENASLSLPFIIMNVLATIIASYGLLADSTAVVIGAMVIATLLGPIMGIALGLLESSSRLLRRALLAEVIGMVCVLLVSLFIGRLYQDIPAGNELLSRTSPSTFDLIIALAGGAAGAYAMVSPRLSVGLVGVAVATALVPPLSTSGIFLARGALPQAGGAFLLFITNLVAIQFSASMIFLFTGYARFTNQPMRWQAILLRNGVSVALLLLLTIVLGVNLKNVVDRTLYETTIRTELTQVLQIYPQASLTDVSFAYDGGSTQVTAVVRTPVPFTSKQVADMKKQLSPPMGGGAVDLHVLSVVTIETTAQAAATPAFLASPP